MEVNAVSNEFGRTHEGYLAILGPAHLKDAGYRTHSNVAVRKRVEDTGYHRST